MPNDKNKSDAASEEFDLVEDQNIDQSDSPDDVSALVSAVRDQVQFAQDRHTDALSEMQRRLGSLDGDVGSLSKNVNDIRQRIPEDLPQKLEGLETGLESLNERVAKIAIPGGVFDTQANQSDAPEEPALDAPASDEIQFDEFDEEIIVNDLQDDVELATDDDDNATEHFEELDALQDFEQTSPSAPAVLMSAAIEEQQSEVTFAQAEPAPQSEQTVDTFDMVDTSVSSDLDSPWDENTAEALTQVCDQQTNEDLGVTPEETAVMPARTPDPEFSESDMHFDTPPAQGHSAPSHGSGDAIDRNWLDAKFTEIAERIEQTLNDLDPSRSAAELGERIQSFEDRVGTALNDVATRADVDVLHGLKDQMANAEVQMQRLESIEGTLNEVVTRFTEGGGMAQFAEMEGLSAGGIDPNQVAEVAAARIADHLSEAGQGGDQSAINDVRTMIEEFLNEHRQGSENTTMMLDTIQQAMVRILDRLDALEAAGGPAMGVATADTDAAYGSEEVYQEPVQDAEHVASASEGWVDAVAGAGGHGSDDDITLTAGAADTHGPDEAMVEFHNPDPSQTEVMSDESPEQLAGTEVAASTEQLAGSAPQAQPVAEGQPTPDLLSDRGEAVTVPAEASPKSRDAIERIRHNFIADAQKAKAMAAQAAAESAADPKGKKPSRKSVLSRLTSKGDTATGDNAEGGFFANKTRRLLVGALLAVIAIQGAMFFVPRGEDSATGTAAPASISAPEAQKPKKPAAPKLEKQSHVLPGDGFSPPVEDKVILNDLRRAAQDSADRASGAVDLPFGLLLQQTTAKEWTKEGRPIFEQKQPVATPIALTSVDAVDGSRTYKAPSKTQTERVEMPPLMVGPTSLRMAAAKGDPSAQFEVATRLSEGKGAKQDFNQAATWFKRSAGQGFAQAQYRLGTLYERGLGVKRDINRAQMWYLRAAEQGNIRAMHNLAVLQAGQTQTRGQPDYARAAQWFLKAANSGLADSQFNAGVLYENGLGVAEDKVQAYKWYTLAARTGDKESLKRSQKIREQLPIDKLGEAETAVRSFEPDKVEPLVNNARLAGQEWKSRHNG